MVQIIGSASEIVLFLSGFFLGKEMFIIAAAFMAFRLVSKIAISELMYKRMQAVVKEESNV
jgi:hypothetical protein